MPYCPKCQLGNPSSSFRCPLDGSLLVCMVCPECAQEIGPQDAYCGHCGWDLSRKRGQLQAIPLRSAGLGRRIGAWLFDGISTFWVLKWLVGMEGLLPQLLVSLVATLLWVTVVERLGQRSPGQRIFSLQKLGTRLHWVPE